MEPVEQRPACLGHVVFRQATEPAAGEDELELTAVTAPHLQQRVSRHLLAVVVRSRVEQVVAAACTGCLSGDLPERRRRMKNIQMDIAVLGDNTQHLQVHRVDR